jgi:molecular chaperone DnaK
MPGRIAIDFGSSNTRIAVWDKTRQQGETIAIPGISFEKMYAIDNQEYRFAYIPSLICYDDNEVLIGSKVLEKDPVLDLAGTFKWIKTYVSNKLDLARPVNNRRISFREAGADYLTMVINLLRQQIDFGDEEVAFTVPVESFEYYQDWLAMVCGKAGIKQWRLLDEASAAALGYGVNIQVNDVYMVFDFGGGSLDISIVRIEGDTTSGKRCRVLGKSGVDQGGNNITAWLYLDFLKRNKKRPEDALALSGFLISEIEKIKERLSVETEVDVEIRNPLNGEVYQAGYTRSSFEKLLESNELFGILKRTTDQALMASSERGFSKSHIKDVLMVGGSSLIPSVKNFVTDYFGDCVKYHRPLDAVAVGGAAFVSGIDFYDHIQHDYALRYYNLNKHDFDYKVIVKSGTNYPTKGYIADLKIKAAFDQQEMLGIDIYELGNPSEKFSNEPVKIMFDVSGRAHVKEVSQLKINPSSWVNEKSPTFIRANPPAEKDVTRFEAKFSIDKNKYLCITVFDLLTGKWLMKDSPMIELSKKV